MTPPNPIARKEGEVLLALAERCEAATGLDNTLNSDILRAIGWTSQDGRVFDPIGVPRGFVPDLLCSLDAAMTLIPEWTDSWGVGIWSDTGISADIFYPMPGSPGLVDQASGKGASVALALCAAALRARALSPARLQEEDK